MMAADGGIDMKGCDIEKMPNGGGVKEDVTVATGGIT
jgi:hypothetical protein